MSNPTIPLWTAPRRIYLDKNGAPIPAGGGADPVTLLVNQGATIALSLAVALGLASGSGATAPSPAMPTFVGALQATYRGEADTLLALLGDSTGFGVGSSAPAYNVCAQVASLIDGYTPLRSAVGLMVPGDGASAAQNGMYAGAGWAYSLGANTLGYGDRACWYAIGSGSAAGPATVALGVVADTYTVWYISDPANAPFTVAATGGGAVAASIANAYSVRSVTVSASAASAANVVTITPTGQGGVFVVAVEARLSTQKRVLIGNCGVGATAAQADWVQDGSINPLGNALACVRAHAPHASIIGLGKNDANNSASVATYLAALDTLRAACALSGDVMVRTESPSVGAPRSTFEPQYVAALPVWCAARGLPLIDVYGRVYGGAAPAAGSALSGDGLHGTDLAYSLEAVCVFATLKPYIDYAAATA